MRPQWMKATLSSVRARTGAEGKENSFIGEEEGKGKDSQYLREPLEDEEIYEGELCEGKRHGYGVVYYPRKDLKNRLLFKGNLTTTLLLLVVVLCCVVLCRGGSCVIFFCFSLLHSSTHIC